MGMQPIVFQVEDKPYALHVLSETIPLIRMLSPEFSNSYVEYAKPDIAIDKPIEKSIVVHVPLFSTSDDAETSRHALLLLLESLTRIDQKYLLEHPDTPKLYDAGVVYRPEFGTEEWQDIPTTLKRGYGDCEDLSTHRSAEIRNEGHSCISKPYIRWQYRNGAPRFHALVELCDGSIEDPSLKLGMRKWNDYLART